MTYSVHSMLMVVLLHLIVDEKNIKLGIQEIRPIDSSKIRKVKEVTYKKDPQQSKDC